MLRLKRGQLTVLVEGLRDAANVAAGALIFGQALSDRPFSSTLAALGIFTWLALLTFATVLAGRRE
jgi:hypothetical protein